MTKLMQWMLFATLFLGIWTATVTSNLYYKHTLIGQCQQILLFLPLILLFLFSLYSATVILYRVFTFNNCESAAIELDQQIKEAKKDLRTKGVAFK